MNIWKMNFKKSTLFLVAFIIAAAFIPQTALANDSNYNLIVFNPLATPADVIVDLTLCASQTNGSPTKVTIPPLTELNVGNVYRSSGSYCSGADGQINIDVTAGERKTSFFTSFSTKGEMTWRSNTEAGIKLEAQFTPYQTPDTSELKLTITATTPI